MASHIGWLVWWRIRIEDINMNSKFTVVFFNIPINGVLAGKVIQTDDGDFFKNLDGYSRNDDFSLGWQQPRRPSGPTTIVGKWFEGH